MTNKPTVASGPRRGGPWRLRLPPSATAAMLVVAAYCGVHSVLAVDDMEDPLLASNRGIAGARRHRLVAHRSSRHQKRRVSSRGEDDDAAEDGPWRMSGQAEVPSKPQENGRIERDLVNQNGGDPLAFGAFDRANDGADDYQLGKETRGEETDDDPEIQPNYNDERQTGSIMKLRAKENDFGITELQEREDGGQQRRVDPTIKKVKLTNANTFQDLETDTHGRDAPPEIIKNEPIIWNAGENENGMVMKARNRKTKSQKLSDKSSSDKGDKDDKGDKGNKDDKDDKGNKGDKGDRGDRGDKGDDEPVGGEPNIATKAKKDKDDEPKPGISKKDKKDKDDEPSIAKKDKKNKDDEPNIAKQDKKDKDHKPTGDVSVIDDGAAQTKRKIAIIRRPQTYFGHLYPLGAVYIAHADGESGGGTTAYDLRSVVGLDPMCDRTVEESHCLCGYCANCNLMTNPDDKANCNSLDSCMFVGHGFARPKSLYLKLDRPDRYLNQITVYFKRGKSQKTGDECGEITVDRDKLGLFRIERPEGCEDAKKPGIGTEVSIDYTGDGEVDVSLHTSCSVPLYAGMEFEGSPFVLEGYCLGENEGGGCTHLDQRTGRVCAVAHPAGVATAPPTSGPTLSPTDSPATLSPTTAEPTTKPTVSPTHGPTSSPVRRNTLYNVTDDNGNPLFDPRSKLVAYTSDDCGPRGPNAYFNDREECPRGFVLVNQRFGREDQVVVAVVDSCHYYSFQVFECIDLPPVEDQPIVTLPPFELQPIENSRASNKDDGLLFDPASTLVSYSSANCGPRGPSAEADYGPEQCPHGFMKVEEDFGGRGRDDLVIAVVDGCQYFSFQVYRCLPSLMDRPLGSFHGDGRRALKHDVVDSLSLLAMFDPTSTLTGYISEDCGPRGKNALADLEQCEPDGHEKVEWVPWQDGRVVAEIDGCAYFSFEVYECLPGHRIDVLHDPGVSGADAEDEAGEDFNEGLEFTTSCAVLVADGSCGEPEADSGFFIGATTEDELVKDSQYDAEQLDGKVILFHDYYGTVIGCGTIRPII